MLQCVHFLARTAGHTETSASYGMRHALRFCASRLMHQISRRKESAKWRDTSNVLHRGAH